MGLLYLEMLLLYEVVWETAHIAASLYLCHILCESIYMFEGPGIDSRFRREFFPWHLTVPCSLGSTEPLKMNTRIILGVKATGA